MIIGIACSLPNLAYDLQFHPFSFAIQAGDRAPIEADGFFPVNSNLFLLILGLFRSKRGLFEYNFLPLLLFLILLFPPNSFFPSFFSPDKNPRVCPVSIPLNVLTSASSGSTENSNRK